MLAGICGIIIAYAIGVVIVHWLARRRHRSGNRHYVLVAGNHERQIEWYVRSLMSYSRRSGMDIHITVVLENSHDDTAAIVRRFARDDRGIDWRYDRTEKAELSLAEKKKEERELVWIELGRQEDVARLPL